MLNNQDFLQHVTLHIPKSRSIFFLFLILGIPSNLSFEARNEKKILESCTKKRGQESKAQEISFQMITLKNISYGVLCDDILIGVNQDGETDLDLSFIGKSSFGKDSYLILQSDKYTLDSGGKKSKNHLETIIMYSKKLTFFGITEYTQSGELIASEFIAKKKQNILNSTYIEGVRFDIMDVAAEGTKNFRNLSSLVRVNEKYFFMAHHGKTVSLKGKFFVFLDIKNTSMKIFSPQSRLHHTVEYSP